MPTNQRVGKKGITADSAAPRLNGLLRRVVFGFGSLLITSATALSVEAPYADNFDSYSTGATPNNFSTQTTGLVITSNWSVQNPSGFSGVYENSIFGDDALSSAAVSVTNLNNSDFLLSTNFVLNSYNEFQTLNTDITVGVAALGFTSDFSRWGYDFSYEVLERNNNGSVTGALEMSRAGLFFASNTSVTLDVTQGTTYTMTLAGHYAPSGLVLTGILTNGNNSISLTATDPQPLQGNYFGYYDKASGNFNHPASVDVSFDNFSINVPEPPITWLIGLGTAVLGLSGLVRKTVSS